MLQFLKNLFSKPKEPQGLHRIAPYKVEPPATVMVDGHGDAQEVKEKPKKAPAKKRQFDKKPAAIKAPAKPKKPKTPKTPK